MLVRFRRAYSTMPGNPNMHATHLMYSLEFVNVSKMPGNLRFIARKIPIVCIERTPFFKQDDEIIGLALQCTNVYALSPSFVSNLDISYVVNALFQYLVRLDGVWGSLSFIADRHLSKKTTGGVLQARLLNFLLHDDNIYNVYKHANGTVCLHHGTARLRLSSCHRLPYVNVVDAPVNVHPIDLWCSFRTTFCAIQLRYGITNYASKVLATAANHLPPRHEFYNSPFHDGMRHGNQVRRTVLKLLSILDGMDGVRSQVLIDGNNKPVVFHGGDDIPVRLLHYAESEDPSRVWQHINRAVESEMGVSLVDVLAGDRFTFDNWAWFGFFVHPLFRVCSAPDFPQKIIQVSCHVQSPNVNSPQSDRFSPWLVYDPSNTAAVGPRLMKQTALEPKVLHIFSSETIGSGNQIMVALQHFTNTRHLLTNMMRPEMDMEMFWARVLTHHRHLENNKVFVQPTLVTTFIRQQPGPDARHGKNRFFLTCPIQPPVQITSQPLNNSNGRGSKIVLMLPKLPHDVLVKIYKLLWCVGASPMFRNVIPDVWWNTPKQVLYYCCIGCPFDSYLYVNKPILELTNEHGVLRPIYQSEILSFFREISFSVDDWGAPFDEWPADFLPKSRSFVLPGLIPLPNLHVEFR